MKGKLSAVLFGFLSLGGVVAWAQLSGLFLPDVPGISVAELAAAASRGGFALQAGEDKQPYLLVDVRDDNEFAVSMIPGAVTRAEYELNRARYAGHRIIPYCTVGYRSGKYTEALIEQGVDAVNFEGSIMAWVEAGLPLVTPQGADTRRVHTWSRQIAAPPGYEQVVD